jgi:hypothetical protein
MMHSANRYTNGVTFLNSVFLKIKPAKTLKNIPTAHIQGVKYSSMNCNVLKDSGIGYDVIL